MRGAGLDQAECALAIERMEHDPAFLAARKMQQLQRKLESVLENQQKLWELTPQYERIEKRVVTHDWPAMQRWSPHDLKARFGHLEVEIQD